MRDSGDTREKGARRTGEPSERPGPIPVRELMSHLSGAGAPSPGDGGPSTVGGAAAAGGRPDMPPGGEAPPDVEFEADGMRWRAREVGRAAWGTDALGAAVVSAVHFFRADRPERPAREALLPRGRLSGLHESELAALLERAAEVPPEGTVVQRSRGGRSPRRGRGARGRPERRGGRGGAK